MIRSLWSGVAGLKTHQMKMDVIGNNVANVNTTSYKAEQTTFGDLLYQTTRRANGATDIRSGTNAKQIGLGAKTSAIMTNVAKQGSIQTTDNGLDVSISGDSFFVVENHNGELNYTRDGSFSVDANGYLVTRSDGYYVRGSLDENGDAGTSGRIQVLPLDDAGNMIDMEGEATTYARITGYISRLDKTLSTEAGRTVDLEFYGTDGNTYTMRLQFTDAGDDNPTTYQANITAIYDSNHKRIEGGLPEETSIALNYDPSTGKLVESKGFDDAEYLANHPESAKDFYDRLKDDVVHYMSLNDTKGEADKTLSNTDFVKAAQSAAAKYLMVKGIGNALQKPEEERTDEEKAILNGEDHINRDLYYSKKDTKDTSGKSTGDEIDSSRVLPNGKLIDIRPHVRFIHFPLHTHNYVEFIYMCQGETVHIIDGQRITLKQGDLLFLNQHAKQ